MMQPPRHVFVGGLLLVGMLVLCAIILPRLDKTKEFKTNTGVIVANGVPLETTTAPSNFTSKISFEEVPVDQDFIARVVAFAATRKTHYEVPVPTLSLSKNSHTLATQWREITPSNHEVAIFAFGNKLISASRQHVTMKINAQSISVERPPRKNEWMHIKSSLLQNVHTLSVGSRTVKLESDAWELSDSVFLNNVTQTGQSRGHAIFSNFYIKS